MKNLVLSLVVIVAVSFYFLNQNSPPNVSSDIQLPTEAENSDSTEKTFQLPVRVTEENIQQQNVAASDNLLLTLEGLLENAHSSSEKYKLIMELLKKRELETLELLGLMHFPQGLDLDDPRYEQIMMINRAMMEVYGQKPLAETLDKLELMRSSDLLYGVVVNDLFFAAEGKENLDTTYNWIIENPDEYAAQSSGRTIGGKLADFGDPEVAIDKAAMLPEGSIRSQALSTLVSNLAQEDFDSAMNFVLDAEPSQDYDQVLSDMVSVSLDLDKDYEEIIDIAIAPVQDNYRLATLTTLFNKWAADDPQALQSWLSSNQNNYSEEEFIEIKLFAKQALNRFLVQ